MMFSFQSSSQEPISRGPRPKRIKIRIACNACKARKTKCDGARPICGPCAKRTRSLQTCIYRESDGGETSTGVQSHGVGEKTIDRPEQSSYTSERPNDPPLDDDDQASSYSAIVPSGSLFGASGGVHLLPEVTPENKRENTNRVLPKALKELPHLQKQVPRKEPDLQYAIPPRKVADILLNLYWDYVDSAYPWLDRPAIESAYETLWVKDGEPAMNERVLHCLLNLIFATSCVASQGQPPLSRDHSSAVFFARAQELMSYEVMEMYNFEIIQILLLTAVYQQHEKKPQKCFRNIGMAIHIAQELGLHIPETTEAMENPKERDLARQVWNGCVILDRICSMTFGCALKIPQSVAKQGLNSLVLPSDTANTALPSKVNFYISFCRLHHIIGDVLETFYIVGDTKAEQSSSLFFDKFASLFRIDSALKDWARGLHPFFQMPSDAEDPTPTKHITREANVLRARYLSVRLLLFRLLLLQIHQQRPEDSPGSGIGLYTDDQIMPHVVFQCQVNCAKAAADMIEFIGRNSPEQKQAYILPSNWYTVSYVYMAVTNILAAQSSPQIVEYFSAARLRDILQQAHDILKDYEKHPILASRCSSVIKLIEDHAPVEGSHVVGVNTSVQDLVMERQEPQAMSDNLAMVENYSFDWNDWPMFFAQLDGDTPAGSWDIEA